MTAENGRTQRLVRILSVSLGGIWFLDGILQFQPAMFTNAFTQSVIAPVMEGQPHSIAVAIALGIQIFNLNVFWANFLSATIQLAIGVLLVVPFFMKDLPARGRWLRCGLWLSVAWAFIVWAFGEGFGGLATGSATFYMGAPGAALLYLILALYLLYATRRTGDAPASAETATSSMPLSRKKFLALDELPKAAGILFIIGGALNLTPMFFEPTMLSMLASVPSVSTWLGGFGATGTMIGNLIAVDLLIGLGLLLIFIPNRTVAWTALGFLAVVWVIGQNFGGIFSFPFGTATDPNAAPLYALFLLPALIGPRFFPRPAAAAAD